MQRRRSKRLRPGKTETWHSSFPSAAPIRCIAALIYDGVLLSGILFVATLILLPLRAGQAFAPNDPFYSAYLIAVGFGFFGWFWTHGGQTLGMRAWNLRLVAVDGGTVSWAQAACRAAAALISGACFGLGYLWAWIDPEKRSWHDCASRTRIVTPAGK